MKSAIKVSNATSKENQKCGNPDCTCENCNCGSNCNCADCK